MKEWNRDALNEIFNLLEFRTLGKRILGENYGGAGAYTAPEGVQTDLFGNAVKPAGATKKKPADAPEKLQVLEEATTRLEAAVERGEEVVITRHGKAVARLVPDRPRHDVGRAQDAAARIRARAASLHASPFDWDEWKKHRDDGRP